MPPSRSRGAARKQQQPRRTHNLGGCTTCRRRHVKCDRIRPTCTTCHNAGLACEGFPSQIRWASMSYPPARDSDSQEYRTSSSPSQRSSHRPAATDHGRDGRLSQGSEQPTTNLFAPSHTDYCYDINAPALFHDNSLAETGNTHHTLIDPSAPDIGAVEDDMDFAANNPDVFSCPSTSSLSGLESLFDTSSGLVWNDLFDPTFNLSMPMIQDQAYGDPLSLLAHVANQPQGRVPVSQLYGRPLAQSQSYDKQNMGSVAAILDSQPPPYAPEEISESEVLEDAKVLLKHFRDVVIPQFAPLPMSSKSPWEILNWSAAVRSHADMTFLKSHDVKHANMANLFAVLGCSAHNITKTQLCIDTLSPIRGAQILEYASKRAKKHMQESLRLETSGSQKAKYKDQLMAIFSLIALATLRGNSTDARRYLIDAERLLRLRGLAKQEVSRRARLLHHVYTWLRIIGESTFILHDHNSSGLQARIEKAFRNNREAFNVSPALEKDTRVGLGHSQLDDFLRVESHSTDSEYDADVSKDQESGLRDIHLEDLRPWSNTLYMDIYGIPETWLSLVSQTTRAANIMDFLERTSVQAPRAFMGSLHKKTARLEHMICSFSAQHSVSGNLSPPCEGPHQKGTSSPRFSLASQAMLRALSSALVILFYRRIRKVHPLILQGHVNDIITALKDFDLAQDADNIRTPGTPWPAFIAGCEAILSSSRDWLLSWIQKGANRSAFNGFTSSQQVMREVWEQRDAIDKGHSSNYQRSSGYKKGEVYSWIDVLRERKLWLMLY